MPMAQESQTLPGHGLPSIWIRRNVHHHHGFFEARDEPLHTSCVPTCSCYACYCTFCLCPRKVCFSHKPPRRPTHIGNFLTLILLDSNISSSFWQENKAEVDTPDFP